MATICYMSEYVEDEGYLDGALLSEPFRSFYKELKEGVKPNRQWTKQLKAALCRDEEPFKTPAQVYEGEPVRGYVYLDD